MVIENENVRLGQSLYGLARGVRDGELKSNFGNGASRIVHAAVPRGWQSIEEGRFRVSQGLLSQIEPAYSALATRLEPASVAS